MKLNKNRSQIVIGSMILGSIDHEQMTTHIQQIKTKKKHKYSQQYSFKYMQIAFTNLRIYSDCVYVI